VIAQVAKLSIHEIASRLRNHYLRTVRGSTDSRSDNNVKADETLVRDRRLTCVNTDPNPDRG
jgi:hypothetical protein